MRAKSSPEREQECWENGSTADGRADEPLGPTVLDVEPGVAAIKWDVVAVVHAALVHRRGLGEGHGAVGLVAGARDEEPGDVATVRVRVLLLTSQPSGTGLPLATGWKYTHARSNWIDVRLAAQVATPIPVGNDVADRAVAAAAGATNGFLAKLRDAVEVPRRWSRAVGVRRVGAADPDECDGGERRRDDCLSSFVVL